MDSLLINKEIKDILLEVADKFYDELDAFEVDVKVEHIALTTAQDTKTKRKLMEWIEGRYAEDVSGRSYQIRISHSSWQALKKEVGL